MNHKLRIFVFSEKAYCLACYIKTSYVKKNPKTSVNITVKCRALPELFEERSLSELCGDCFRNLEDMIFISATGIAVRGIASHLVHKAKDPAVVVIDEGGRHCISLLSGHLGGANDLTLELADMIGAEAVITTASDIRRCFSIDLFAISNRLRLSDFQKARALEARVLSGKKIRLYSELPLSAFSLLPNAAEGEWLPSECFPEAEIIIAFHKSLMKRAMTGGQLFLLARRIYVGIGSRKGVGVEEVREAVIKCLCETDIMEASLAAICSIDIKREEKGICETAKEMGLPYLTFSSEELRSVEGYFHDSDFVRNTVGVSNVCERAACRGAGQGSSLIMPKRICKNVTVALALDLRPVAASI